MGAIIKLLIGAILMIAAVWWVIPDQGGAFQLIGRDAVDDLIALLNGAVPVGVFIIGLFIIWLELDEIRIEREIRAEKRKKKR